MMASNFNNDQSTRRKSEVKPSSQKFTCAYFQPASFKFLSIPSVLLFCHIHLLRGSPYTQHYRLLSVSSSVYFHTSSASLRINKCCSLVALSDTAQTPHHQLVDRVVTVTVWGNDKGMSKYLDGKWLTHIINDRRRDTFFHSLFLKEEVCMYAFFCISRGPWFKVFAGDLQIRDVRVALTLT